MECLEERLPGYALLLDDECSPTWPLQSPETQSGPPTATVPKSRRRHLFFLHFPSVWTGKDRLVTEDTFISLIGPDGDTVQDKWHRHKLTAHFKSCRRLQNCKICEIATMCRHKSFQVLYIKFQNN